MWNNRELRFTSTLVGLRPLGAVAPRAPSHPRLRRGPLTGNRLRRTRFARTEIEPFSRCVVVRSATFAERFRGRLGRAASLGIVLIAMSRDTPKSVRDTPADEDL